MNTIKPVYYDGSQQPAIANSHNERNPVLTEEARKTMSGNPFYTKKQD
ncbi:hypothetical protein ACFQPF_05300 [Fictibacillus iocasae]|uniref:Small, acid-soluble spore protein K n=1 Tax=Fictibacillus iocasae TaxID=2715437 RepID=A0ABW2NNW3_9BACL